MEWGLLADILFGRARRLNLAAEVKYEKAHKTENIALNASSKAFIFLSLIAVILFCVLFSNYPPLHDFFHELRHSLVIIPCH